MSQFQVEQRCDQLDQVARTVRHTLHLTVFPFRSFQPGLVPEPGRSLICLDSLAAELQGATCLPR